MHKESITQQYLSKNQELELHLENIKQIVKNYRLEGNCFYVHNTLNRYEDLFSKQVNLFWCGTLAKTNICEIGFNAGHSALLMLLGRDKTPLNFTIYDIGYHPYTKPSFEYIKSKFNHINFEYIEGDSTVELPKNKNLYDIVHIDGGHSEHCIINDMKNSIRLVKLNGIIIVDDVHMSYIDNQVTETIASGCFEELDVLPTKGYPHRIIKKIK